MNIQQLRQSLKMKWLSYYQQNRTWLVKMRIWGTYEGLRRPSSGFILATLSVLEPQFDQILVFILDLNNNPDRIVAALGLNFNPEKELSLTSSEHSTAVNQMTGDLEHSTDVNQIPDDSPLDIKASTAGDVMGLLPRPTQSSFGKGSSDPIVGRGKEQATISTSNQQSSLLPVACSLFPRPKVGDNRDNSETSVAVTEVATKSPSKAVYNYQPGQGFARREKVVSSATVNARKTSDRHPADSVAVATQMHRASPSKMLLFDKPHSRFPRIPKPGRSPLEQLPSGASLAILNDVPRPPKTLLSLSASEVSRNGKTLSSLTVPIKIPSDGKPEKIPLKDFTDKVKPSPSTNARSLASWVDEFCQGSEWNPEEAIFIQF
jgi:hypothetical protein